MDGILYKYLDAEGGAAMLYNKNLMFTNATQLNDPFDCHQKLIDFSKSKTPRVLVLDEMGLVPQEEKWCEEARNQTWICSFSKVYDSMLMWAFYGNNHQGMCIGIDIDKAKQYLDKVDGFFKGCLSYEVQYKDIQNRPEDDLDKTQDFLPYLFATKAKDWEHEQEVRFVAIAPSPRFMKLLQKERKIQLCEAVCERIRKAFRKIKNVSQKNTDEAAPQDWRKVHAFTDLGGECFASLYFGANMEICKRDKIIEFAKQVNPNIKIYQMTTDPEAFRLKEVEIK